MCEHTNTPECSPRATFQPWRILIDMEDESLLPAKCKVVTGGWDTGTMPLCVGRLISRADWLVHASTNHHAAGAEPLPRGVHKTYIPAPSQELLDRVSPRLDSWASHGGMDGWSAMEACGCGKEKTLQVSNISHRDWLIFDASQEEENGSFKNIVSYPYPILWHLPTWLRTKGVWEVLGAQGRSAMQDSANLS